MRWNGGFRNDGGASGRRTLRRRDSILLLQPDAARPATGRSYERRQWRRSPCKGSFLSLVVCRSHHREVKGSREVSRHVGQVGRRSASIGRATSAPSQRPAARNYQGGAANFCDSPFYIDVAGRVQHASVSCVGWACQCVRAANKMALADRGWKQGMMAEGLGCGEGTVAS